MKERHDLWQSSSAADFISRNAALGIQLNDVLSSLTRNSSDASMMLVGSVAERLANPESDVDLLLLVDNETQLNYSAVAEWSFSTGEPYKPVTVKLFPHGVELDIEVCVLDRATELQNSVDALVKFMGDTSKADGIPKLQHQEVRFIHQLRSGWVLANDPVANRWQQRFQTQHLPLYSMVTNFIEYMELLEDVISAQRKGALLDVANIGRICSEHAALTLLGIGGQTNPNRKWIARLVDDLKQRTPELAPLATLTMQVLFPPAPLSPQVADEYVASLRQLGGHLKHLMNRNESIKAMFDVLFSKLHYLM